MDDPAYTRTFHTNTGAYRVYAVVIRFNRNFSTFAGNTCDGFYRDQAIVYFRHFKLQTENDGKGRPDLFV